MTFFRILFSTLLLAAFIGCKPIPNEPDTPRQPEQPTQPEEPTQPEKPKPPRPEVAKIGAWLKTIPGVSEVQELDQGNYTKHFMFRFEQLIDPKNPDVGTFSQRVFLSHQNFDHPMVFDAQGYDSQESMTQTHSCELTERYQSNRLEVEHRYSGESVPLALGSSWKYLTCENAAADMHAVRKALGVAYTGNWIATGGSKSGTNALNYSMRYPDDIAATVAYVAPVCNGINDTRFSDFLLRVGTPEMRKKIVDFQRMLLLKRDQLQDMLISTEPKLSNTKETMTQAQEYENFVFVFMEAQLQYGLSVDMIPGADATPEEILTYLAQRWDEKSAVSKGSSKANDKPDFENDHYGVQLLTELGCRAFCTQPLEDLLPKNDMWWTTNYTARFGAPASAADIQFSDAFYKQITKWIKESDPRLICVYGEYDPWTAGAVDRASFVGKSNMAFFIQAGGSHSAVIESLTPTDQAHAWSKLDSWVKGPQTYRAAH